MDKDYTADCGVYVEQILQLLKQLANFDIDEENLNNHLKISLSKEAFEIMRLPNSAILLNERFSKLNDTCSQILGAVATQSGSIRKSYKDSQKGLHEIQAFRNKYPHYVALNAPKQDLKFFNGLKNEEYSFTDAAPLIGLTRQTLSNYVKNRLYGFAPSGKKGKVSKEHIYNYYIKNQR